MSLFATRLKSARLRKGLSIQDLAERLNPPMTKQAISRYEQSLNEPPMHVVFQLCEILDVKPDYFVNETVVEIGPPDYRKLVRFSKKDEQRVIEEVRGFLERYFEAESITGEMLSFTNPISEIVIQHPEQAEKAAQALRERWNLGDQPLSNIVEMLEEKGIKIVEVEADAAFNGFASQVNQSIPLIVLNKYFNKALDRKRFTTLHELGHLILQFGDIADPVKEKACNRFASALLLPEQSLYRELGERRHQLNMAELGKIKMQYGISMAAVLYRANDLCIISDLHYRNFMKAFSMQGYKSGEPSQYEYLGREEPFRFEQIVLRAWSEGLVSQSKAAVLLNLKVAEFMERYLV
jgi:Zn-dependent peptidase ImmA (M78 family)/DNA-binding XRE family transcriptional regulator